MAKGNRKPLLPVIGQTTEDFLVVDGVYALYETHGLPFDVIFVELKDHGRIPSWLHVYRDARKAGVVHGRLLGSSNPRSLTPTEPRSVTRSSRRWISSRISPSSISARS